MNKLAFTARALGAGTALALSGCAPVETFPEQGIVTEKAVVEVDGSCLLSTQGVCILYDQVDEFRVMIQACRRSNEGSVMLADENYLQRHQVNPSDYPILQIDEYSDEETGTVTHCSATFEVSKEQYDQTAIGSIFSAEA